MLDDGPTDLALQEYQNKIINTLEEMTANGLSQNTLRSATYTLKRLNRESRLDESRSRKTVHWKTRSFQPDQAETDKQL
jgi:hypothetical protein